jgi:heterodisulfide reductase subunit D
VSARNLEKHKDYVYSCLRCGSCRDAYYVQENTFLICPVRELTGGFDVYYARGKMMLARKYLEGAIKPSEELMRYIYMCTTCANCREHCRISMNLPGRKTTLDQIAVIEAFRADLVEQGFCPPKIKAFAESIRKNYNPYHEKHSERTLWMVKEVRLPEKADILYFVGCTSSYRRKEIAQNTLDILLKVNVNFTISPNEWCCGSPALRTGWVDVAKEMARHNIELIESIGAKTVVTSCAGCYRTLKLDYPRLVGKPGFEVLHTTELLQRLIGEGKITFKDVNASEKMIVTYHDPCHLGRHVGIYDPPREVLKSLPFVELVEMRRTRSGSWCCGSGGGFKSAFGDLAVQLAEERLREARETGAKALVTSCPFCVHNFLDAKYSMEKRGERVPDVYDIVQLVSKVL